MYKFFICIFLIITFFHSNTLAQTWAKLTDYPDLGRDDAVAFSIGDCGYITTGNHAGFSESNNLWKYNTTTNQWSKMANFPGEKRQYAVAFTNKEFAYILGGISENNVPLNDFYRYNSFTDSWQQLDSFPGKARWSAASAVHKKSAYLFGGATFTGFLNDAWRFDFSAEIWENLDSVPSVGKRDQLCFTLGDKIYLSAGYSINPLIFHSESYSYNSLTKIWNNELDFPSEPIAYGTVANSGTKAIVLGGYRSDNTFSNEAWQFDGEKWVALPTCLSIGQRGMSSFTINNKYYFLTGKKADQTLSKDFYALSFTNENEFLVYPNPSTEEIVFYAPIGSNLEIFNSFGESIEKLNFNFNNETRVKLSDSGVYLTKIIFDDGEVQTKKMVIL